MDGILKVRDTHTCTHFSCAKISSRYGLKTEKNCCENRLHFDINNSIIHLIIILLAAY